jgi:galactokinase
MTHPLQQTVQRAFETAFGAPPRHVVQAPGRVNLIGEHTDYNDGFVLPCAIDFRTLVACSPRDDDLVRVVAADYGGALDEFRISSELAKHPGADWANYVRGVVWMLAREGLPVRGADIAIAGDVPQGAGLSSSASLELALLQAFKTLHGLHELDPTRMARMAQQAENEFVGCNCGIMDQLISARGVAGHALQIDCRSLEALPVALPPGVDVLIAHSRVRRGLVDSAYNERRAQCEQAARTLGVKALRDADEALLQRHADALDPMVLRRARHVITENRRVLEASRALERGDLVTLGALMAASHESMRHDFEITVPAIDQLVALLQSAIGTRGGARMTGGGFGGCVVALLPHERVAHAKAALQEHYRSPEGLPATVYTCTASAGAGVFA